VIYYDEIEIPERWSEDFKISSEMFNESGVVIRKI
jgi:hypothetical protein